MMNIPEGLIMNLKHMKTILVLFFVLVMLGASLSSATVTFTDTKGDTVTLPAPAERIVCLNGDCAEALVVLGAGDTVVGVADSVMNDTALMAHIQKAVSVGNWQTPSVEKILGLKPDAIISYSSSKPKNADQFSNAGIRLIYLDCYKFNTLEHDMVSIGTMIGAEKKAANYNAFLKKWEDTVNKKVESITEENIPSVYIEGYTDFTAQGKDTGIDILTGLVKGKNLAADLNEQYPKVTAEWILKVNPSVILKTATAKADKNMEKVRTGVEKRNGFETLDAVMNNRIYVLNGDLIYGPRSPAGLVYLAKALHPEETKDLNSAEVLKEYAASFVTGTEEGDYYSPVL
jgi:iron complex transport system substrate-binding protein